MAELGERDIWRADQVACVRRLVREHDNVRAALGWTLAGGNDAEPGLRIAAAMVRFWDVHGDLQEGTRWLTQLLALPGVRRGALGWARALTARAYLAITAGDRDQGIALLDECLPFWRGLGDPRGLAVALFFRGLAVALTGTDLQEAVPMFVESLRLAEQRGPRWTAYFCLYCLGETARLAGDLDRAELLLNESRARALAAQDCWGAFYAEYGLAFLAIAQGDLHGATEHAHRGLSFSGFDSHAPSIEHARHAAAAAGLGEDRVRFEVAPAVGYPTVVGGYDLIALFDCLHDMGDPVGAIRHAADTLASDGTVLLVEPMAGERIEDNLNPVGQVYSGASVLICTPHALAESGRALGTIASDTALRDVITAGGLSRFRRATETPFNRVFEARR